MHFPFFSFPVMIMHGAVFLRFLVALIKWKGIINAKNENQT